MSRDEQQELPFDTGGPFQGKLPPEGMSDGAFTRLAKEWLLRRGIIILDPQDHTVNPAHFNFWIRQNPERADLADIALVHEPSRLIYYDVTANASKLQGLIDTLSTIKAQLAPPEITEVTTEVRYCDRGHPKEAMGIDENEAGQPEWRCDECGHTEPLED